LSKVFISHAVVDRKLVECFVDLLHAGMNINYNDIYCTSNGKIPSGESFTEDIRQNLIASNAIIFLMTKSFFESKFCLNEMGAAWLLGRTIIPILTPALNFKILENTAFKGLQARRIHVKNDIVEIYQELVSNGVVVSPVYNRFNLKLDEFISKRPWGMSGTLGSLQAPEKFGLGNFPFRNE
jgi:hypothetical protein